MKYHRMTDHAQARIQQRGIHPDAVEIVLGYGSFRHAKGGATSYYMDKPAHQRARRSLEGNLYRHFADKLDIYVVVYGDAAILTVAHNHRIRCSRRRKHHYDR